MQKVVVQAELAHPTMQGAAMGLTFKNALAIFSEHETLALQRRVNELEKELATFINKKVDARAMTDRIMTRFDTELAYPNDGSLMDIVLGDLFDLLYPTDPSLMGIILGELLSELGDSYWMFCQIQCENIKSLLTKNLNLANLEETAQLGCIISDTLFDYLDNMRYSAQMAVVKADLVHPTMQGAAIGLTCKYALAIFSENETLALQRRVSELEKELALFIHKKVDARAMTDSIITEFDEMFPPETRCESKNCEGTFFFEYEHYSDNSLMGLIMGELLCTLGKWEIHVCRDHCVMIASLLTKNLNLLKSEEMARYDSVVSDTLFDYFDGMCYF